MSVLLKKIDFKGITAKELAQQIEAKKKCKDKLPTWYTAPNIYYPHKVSIEQTSSETTAQYKAEIVDGKSLLDLTGGFGVDSYFFSKKIGQVFHCEMDEELSKIASHNFDVLGAKNIQTFSKNGLEFLKESSQKFDWIYIDPSRRNDAKGKVFMMADCLPNVPEHMELLFRKTDTILMKTSPLLDFSIGIRELQFVKEIHIVAVKNEVKELLWILERGYLNDISIKTINLTKSARATFDFVLSEEKKAIAEYALPQNYLYEPNAAILKSGAFKTVGNCFGLRKLQEHTHLYTSNELLLFAGRRFKIEQTVPYNKKNIQKLGVQKANITTRNFPESVATIRKKFKITDGGDIYLFFTTDMDGDYVTIKCSKL